jgi:hypothetical protein
MRSNCPKCGFGVLSIWTRCKVCLVVLPTSAPNSERETVMLETQKYRRKPFFVEAVQVTQDNLEAVASWTGGKVQTLDAVAEKNQNAPYVKVNVPRAVTERQTQAFIGDWVLKAGSGFKCYTDKAFKKSFDLREEQPVVASHGWTEDPGPINPTPVTVAPFRYDEIRNEAAPVPVNPIEMTPAQMAARFPRRQV